MPRACTFHDKFSRFRWHIPSLDRVALRFTAVIIKYDFWVHKSWQVLDYELISGSGILEMIYFCNSQVFHFFHIVKITSDLSEGWYRHSRGANIITHVRTLAVLFTFSLLPYLSSFWLRIAVDVLCKSRWAGRWINRVYKKRLCRVKLSLNLLYNFMAVTLDFEALSWTRLY